MSSDCSLMKGKSRKVKDVQVIILAGGKGTRLLPYTMVLPKPLMPIKDMPVMEVVIRQLRYYGFKSICIATGHLSELIETFFKDGSKFGVDIRYSIEDRALGTAGPIRLVSPLSENFLVMNGDLLTTLNYRELFDFHIKSGAIATVATHPRTVSINFGIVDADEDGRLKRYTEKPSIDYRVSMGINVFHRRILDFIAEGQPLDIPDLISKLVQGGEEVICYQPDCFWLDIGRTDDYQKAVEIYCERKKEFILE
jgi:NDP-sugar pyrophosphorylase family protein